MYCGEVDQQHTLTHEVGHSDQVLAIKMIRSCTNHTLYSHSQMGEKSDVKGAHLWKVAFL